MADHQQTPIPGLRVAYSRPKRHLPPERMLEAIYDAGIKLLDYDPNRATPDERARFAEQLRPLMERVNKAEVYNTDDVLGVVAFVVIHIIDPMCNRDPRDPALPVARELLAKAMAWLLGQPPSNPKYDRPRLCKRPPMDKV